MSFSRKEKIKLILALAFSVWFILASVFTADMTVFTAISDLKAPTEEIASVFSIVFGGAFHAAALLWCVGTFSSGLLAAFFARSLKSHENMKIRKAMKLLSVFDLCFLGVDILFMSVLLL